MRNVGLFFVHGLSIVPAAVAIIGVAIALEWTLAMIPWT